MKKNGAGFGPNEVITVSRPIRGEEEPETFRSQLEATCWMCVYAARIQHGGATRPPGGPRDTTPLDLQAAYDADDAVVHFRARLPHDPEAIYGAHIVSPEPQ